MLTILKSKEIFLVFSEFCKFLFGFMVLQIFFCFRFYKFLFCFRHKIESIKDTRYKLPLVGVLPQASFRLIDVGRG